MSVLVLPSAPVTLGFRSEWLAAITVGNAELLSRYEFSMRSIEFLVCRECGVYVAGFMSDPTDVKAYATLMVSALDERKRFPQPSSAFTNRAPCVAVKFGRRPS